MERLKFAKSAVCNRKDAGRCGGWAFIVSLNVATSEEIADPAVWVVDATGDKTKLWEIGYCELHRRDGVNRCSDDDLDSWCGQFVAVFQSMRVWKASGRCSISRSKQHICQLFGLAQHWFMTAVNAPDRPGLVNDPLQGHHLEVEVSDRILGR